MNTEFQINKKNSSKTLHELQKQKTKPSHFLEEYLPI